MAKQTKNMLVDDPPHFRRPAYGEHYCHIFAKDGGYVGALYLDAKMRKIWRANKLRVVIADV